jgi:transposase
MMCLAVLAKEYPFASRLNSQARQASADCAWFAISRFYDNCKNKKPGKKGYPNFSATTGRGVSETKMLTKLGQYVLKG